MLSGERAAFLTRSVRSSSFTLAAFLLVSQHLPPSSHSPLTPDSADHSFADCPATSICSLIPHMHLETYVWCTAQESSLPFLRALSLHPYSFFLPLVHSSRGSLCFRAIPPCPHAPFRSVFLQLGAHLLVHSL